MKGRALQWLSQREHSRSELRRKLLPHALAGAGDSPDVSEVAAQVDAVLDALEASRYLSDQRFVESRVHAREGRYGNLRIRQELQQHRLRLAPEAARALRESEEARARAVRRRKFPTRPETPAERARQARFLAGRGFSPDVIARVLRTDDIDAEPDPWPDT